MSARCLELRWLFKVLSAVPFLLSVGARAWSQPAQRAHDLTIEVLATKFSSAGSVFPLGNGRLLLADAREQQLLLVDFASDSVASLSRVGSGPREFRFPGALLQSHGDTVAYWDDSQQRLLLLSRLGGIVGTRALPRDAIGRGIIGLYPRAFQKNGTLVAERVASPSASFGPAESAGSGSGADQITALDGSGSATPLVRGVRLRPPQLSQMEQRDGRRFYRITAWDFAPLDQWCVLPDDRIALLRNGNYQIEFWRNGRMEQRGPPVPHAEIAVTDLDRAESIASAEQAANVLRKRGAEVRVEAPRRFNPVKTPFSALWCGYDGTMIVSRPPVAGKSSRAFDLLHRNGGYRLTFDLATDRRVLGLDQAFVYLAWEDEDGFTRLGRARLPTVSDR